MKEFLCINGPMVGKYLPINLARVMGYIMYNSSCSGYLSAILVSEETVDKQPGKFLGNKTTKLPKLPRKRNTKIVPEPDFMDVERVI